jgi:nicotinate-nucleotide pyrophosphorylase (carboxylating)
MSQAAARVPLEAVTRVVGWALEEDLGARGDPTSRLLGDTPAVAALVARGDGVIAGLPALPVALDLVAERLGSGAVAARCLVQDGDRVQGGSVLAELHGSAPTMLAAERTLLNLVGRLSGVATLTAAFVAAIAGTGAVIRDTRKTTPGLRELEKYAVRCGGGANHRMGLFDALLVKDNHIRAAGSLAAAVTAARRAAPELPLEVEVETLQELQAALDLGCELVLLDNMPLAAMAEAVRRSHGRARLEASGGVTLATVAAVARTGVDYVSVGALTHAATSLDVALDWSGRRDLRGRGGGRQGLPPRH